MNICETDTLYILNFLDISQHPSNRPERRLYTNPHVTNIHTYIYIYAQVSTHVDISQRFSQAVRPFSGLSTASSLPRKQQKPGAAEPANPALRDT